MCHIVNYALPDFTGLSQLQDTQEALAYTCSVLSLLLSLNVRRPSCQVSNVLKSAASIKLLLWLFCSAPSWELPTLMQWLVWPWHISTNVRVFHQRPIGQLAVDIYWCKCFQKHTVGFTFGWNKKAEFQLGLTILGVWFQCYVHIQIYVMGFILQWEKNNLSFNLLKNKVGSEHQPPSPNPLSTGHFLRIWPWVWPWIWPVRWIYNVCPVTCY